VDGKPGGQGQDFQNTTYSMTQETYNGEYADG
jgi:hypothetical protein